MVLQNIIESIERGKKLFAVLIDPDKYDEDGLIDLVNLSKEACVDYFFVGGSLMTTEKFERTIEILKRISNIPVVIFPGSNVQINKSADAILLLSLISGRNPEYLIGQHVVAAPYLKKSGLEVIPTAYMLIEGEKITTANYVSNTLPIPKGKDEIAVSTALAGEMLGMKIVYMDGGSGAGRVISTSMIESVKQNVNIPLIIGGGIDSAEKAEQVWNAGADMLVVGNAIEKDLSLITSIGSRIKSQI